MKKICVWLGAEAVATLKALAAEHGQTHEQVIEGFLLGARREPQTKE